MEYTIEQAAPEHVPLLNAIELAAVDIFPPGFLPAHILEDKVPLDVLDRAREQGLLWVVLDGGQAPVGYALVQLIDGHVLLAQMDVHPDHGRKGLGAALVGRVARQVRTMGFSALYLTTFSHIPWNAPFYERLGFRRMEQGDQPLFLQEIVRRSGHPGSAGGWPCAWRSRMRRAGNLPTRSSWSDRAAKNTNGRTSGMTISWIILGLLLASGLTMLWLYVQSVTPETRERLTGDPDSYKKCSRLRWLSGIPMAVVAACYVLYLFFPLPVPLPERFPWPWYLSVIAGALVFALSGWICWKGMRDAGRETMAPQKQGSLYGGVYRKIRHPQFYEVLFWWGLALVLHSPFLFLFSFYYLPIWVMMVQAEERDLILRFGDEYVHYWRRTGAFFPRRRDRAGGDT